MAVAQRSIQEVLVDPVQFGRYVLLDTIAVGRTGSVHRACLQRPGKPDKLFAIKRVSAELSRDQAFAEGFAEVMAHAAQLDHPAHCAIEDVDQAADGLAFAAMELIEGKDLGRVAAALVERGATMPAPLVAYVGSQIADALWAAHALTRAGTPAPLYHGELSPEDILIGYDGSVRLTGLGSSVLRELAPQLAARPSYQSPEMLLGAPCSVQSDVFSLGACLYELLTGTKAVPTNAHGSVPASRRRPDSHITQVIPRPLEQIVSRALAEQPQDRWHDTSEMAHALARWCAAQTRPADPQALCAWMLDLFGTACEDEAARLQTWLGRIPAPRSPTNPAQRTSAPPAPVPEPRPSGVPGKATIPPGSSPASARPRTEQPGARKTAPPLPPQSPHADWTDPSERTPARGILMSRLAAEMVVPKAAAEQLQTPEELYDEPWDLETPENQWGLASEDRADAAGSSAPAPAAPAPPPAARKASAPAPAAVAPPPPARRASAPAHTAITLPPPPAAAPPPATWAKPAPRSRLLVPGLIAAAIALLGAGLSLLSHSGRHLSAIHVQSNPTGVEVFVRGERVGITPLRRDGVQSGAATFEFRAPGFETQTRAIELTAGEVAHLQVDMIRHVVTVPPPTVPSSQPREALANDREAHDSAQPYGVRSRDDGNSDRSHHQHHVARDRDEAEPAPAEASLVVQPTDVPATTAAPSVTTEQPAPEPAGSTPEPITERPASASGALAEASPVRLTTPAATTTKVVAPAARSAAPNQAPGVTREPVLLEQSSPKVPARAKRMGVTTGVVSIEYTVDRSGAVTNATVVQADPPGLFDDAALRAIRSWKYRPKLLNGTPVESHLRFRFRFE